MPDTVRLVCRECQCPSFDVAYDTEIVLLTCNRCGYVYFVFPRSFHRLEVVDVDLMEE